MAITSPSGVVAGLGNSAQQLVINKASVSTQIAGAFSSLFRATGTPAQGAIPSTAAICDKSLLGSMGFTNPTSGLASYIGWAKMSAANANTEILFVDRLAHMGGLSGTVTTAQTAGVAVTDSSLTSRKGASDYSGVQWYLEWYTATGSPAVTATISYTNQGGTSGKTTTVSVPASTAAGRAIPIIPLAGDWIRSVETVTLSATTATAGSFGVTAVKFLTSVCCLSALGSVREDWAGLGFPKVEDNACLTMLVLCGTTSTGAIVGNAKLVQG